MCRITNAVPVDRLGEFAVNLTLRSQNLLSCYGTMNFWKGCEGRVGKGF